MSNRESCLMRRVELDTTQQEINNEMLTHLECFIDSPDMNAKASGSKYLNIVHTHTSCKMFCDHVNSVLWPCLYPMNILGNLVS